MTRVLDHGFMITIHIIIVITLGSKFSSLKSLLSTHTILVTCVIPGNSSRLGNELPIHFGNRKLSIWQLVLNSSKLSICQPLVCVSYT